MRPQILFVGAGGTGKSTLLAEMLKSYNVEPVPSSTRETSALFGFTDEASQMAATPEVRWEFQKTLFSKHEAKLLFARELRSVTTVSDRGLLDQLAYALMKSRGPMTAEDLTDMEHRVLKLHRGALTVFFPHGIFTPPPDGFRISYEPERALCDRILRGYLHKWLGKLPVVVAEDGTPEERLASLVRQARHHGLELPRRNPWLA